jgi:glycine oxidase
MPDMAQSFGASATADVVIVGGGIIGLTIARELALHEVREVIVVERSRPGAEASWAAAGILAPQVEADQMDEFFRLACASRDMYREFAAALREETGVDVELDTSGTVYVGLTEEDEKNLRDRWHWQTQAGLIVEWLSGDEARKLEPQISNRVSGALRFPNDIQVENRKLVEALTRANEKFGVRLLSNCEVSSVIIERETIRGVETSRGPIESSVVVIAAGAWSSSISCVSPSINIEPVRGQMLCFNPPSRLARHVIYSSRGYLVPRQDGRLLAGSTSEHVGFDKQVTEAGVNAIRSCADEITPGLRELPLTDSWAGFRPRSSDGLPVIGPSEDLRGLFFATGHYRNGILLAPITGKLLSYVIIDRAVPTSLLTFLPARFRVAAAA